MEHKIYTELVVAFFIRIDLRKINSNSAYLSFKIIKISYHKSHIRNQIGTKQTTYHNNYQKYYHLPLRYD